MAENLLEQLECSEDVDRLADLAHLLNLQDIDPAKILLEILKMDEEAAEQREREEWFKECSMFARVLVAWREEFLEDEEKLKVLLVKNKTATEGRREATRVLQRKRLDYEEELVKQSAKIRELVGHDLGEEIEDRIRMLMTEIRLAKKEASFLDRQLASYSVLPSDRRLALHELKKAERLLEKTLAEKRERDGAL